LFKDKSEMGGVGALSISFLISWCYFIGNHFLS